MAKKSQKKSPSEALIQKGFNYENDKEMLFKRSEKRAWQVNIVLVVLLFMSFGGYFFLLPLKEVKPYLLGFDSSTGIVDPITTVSEEVIEANDALDKHFINQYLSLRESYIYETITNTYELTQLFSNANVAKQFREEYNQADSLDNLLGTGSAKVKVNSITLEEINDKKLAIARIKVSYRNAKNESYSKDYTVRLSYIYEPSTKLQLSHRIDNPVGFFVTSYQKTEENI